MTRCRIAGSNFIQAGWPAPVSVVAFSTTRFLSAHRDGASSAPYDGFNLAYHVADEVRAVQENRAELAALIDCQRIQWLEQVHGCEVVEPHPELETLTADGLYTTQSEVACAVLTADCLPVFFCSSFGDEVAVVHAGWRGLSGGVLERALAKFSAPASQMLAWLGPAIGPSHFEVGEEVWQAFQNQPLNEACFRRGSPSTQAKEAPSRWYGDLYALARLRLGALGVGQVCGGGFCTYGEAERFYSYRREGVTGRMASVIFLRDPPFTER